ncbi:MAG: OmpA family protein [Porphyromonas sp.]|nr:OmpA family protein [Porphyromonas sp.]
MKKVYAIIGVTTLSLAMILSSCGASNTVKGSGIGAGTGAVIGAGIGKATGNTGLGAVIGGVVGGVAGGAIGHQMDKQAKELESQVPEATVEKVNDGEAIKVTFDSGILFDSSSSTLSAASRDALKRFAENMNANPDTDIKIVGHTDSTGRYEYNMKLSEDRAQSVLNYLRANNVAASRMIPLGVGPDHPVVDNSTSANRAKNRRVEIFILPNAKMIQEAQQQAAN